MPKPTYDTTIARIAGNIAAGLVRWEYPTGLDTEAVARISVDLARLIVARVKATEPAIRDHDGEPTAVIVKLGDVYPEIPVSAQCILNGCQHSQGKSARIVPPDWHGPAEDY